MTNYLIAHDLGTSGCKAAITDLSGSVLASAENRYEVHYSPDGGAEQDPEDWWQAIVETTKEMMSKVDIQPAEVVGMSMSAQMVGTLPVDEKGDPLRRAMIWLDSRAENEGQILREKTKLPFIGGKAPSAKVYWIKCNEPEIFAKTYKFLDCKDFLQARMTGVYGTDLALASATTYFNPWTEVWWEDVLEAMEVPLDMLPTAMLATDVVGTLNKKSADQMGLVEGIPVVSGSGDVPCAVIGSGAISPGRSHLYLGTSAWIMAMTTEFVLDAEGVMGGVGCDRNTYALGGEMDNAGGCLKWFHENLISKEDEKAAKSKGLTIFQYMDSLAEKIPPGSEGLIFLPWVWGERSPVDDDNVRGGFVNLGLNHTKAHMFRAMLEGVGFHLRWIFSKIENADLPPKDVNVIGGGATSSIWLQILADTTNVSLHQVEGPLDACARGAAMTAAVGLGFYKDFSEVEKVIKLTGVEFQPNPQHRTLYNEGYAHFRSLYQPFSAIGNKTVQAVDDSKKFSLKGSVESFLFKQWVKSQISKKK